MGYDDLSVVDPNAEGKEGASAQLQEVGRALGSGCGEGSLCGYADHGRAGHYVRENGGRSRDVLRRAGPPSRRRSFEPVACHGRAVT